MASVELIKVLKAKKVKTTRCMAISIHTYKQLVVLSMFYSTSRWKRLTETSLSANQERAETEKKRLVWEAEGSSTQEPKVVRGGPIDLSTLVVELAPMEIRTFIIDFDSKWSTT
jgi:hypothetical protein